jgi:serine/threonine-protein kinase
VSGIAPYHLRGLNAIWLGPSAYHAPERLAGQPASGAGDLYSSGLILYQMLSGVHPFESENGEVTLLRLISGAPPPPLHTFNPAVPLALEAVLLRLLSPEPAGRYASAQEAAQALRAAA